MTRKQARHFSTGVATGASDCHPQSHRTTLDQLLKVRTVALGPQRSAVAGCSEGHSLFFCFGGLRLGKSAISSAETQCEGERLHTRGNPVTSIFIDNFE